MRISNLSTDPIHEFEFLNAGRKPNDFYVDRLPVLHGQVDELPDELEALVFCADLQGREVSGPQAHDPLRLIGVNIPLALAPVLESLNVRSRQRAGVVLAGDFYTYPDLRGRGGTGDVTAVWKSFSTFRWVLGVAGNHDTFGEQKEPPKCDTSYFLDAGRCVVDGIQFAGLSGVIGSPHKNFRRNQHDYLENLELLFSEPTDIGVLHEGPNGDTGKYPGLIEIRNVLESCPPCLLVRGHKHWPEPMIELANGTQVLNVECTIVVLTKE